MTLLATDDALVDGTDAGHARGGRRWRTGAALTAVLAVVAAGTWWGITAERYGLAGGTLIVPGAGASMNHAGPLTETCQPFVAGKPVTIGFSVFNDGSHAVTLTKVGRLFATMSQSVTVDTETHGAMNGLASAVRLPVVLRPGDERLLYLRLTPLSGMSMQAGSRTSTNTVDLSLTVLGVPHGQRFRIDDGNSYFTMAGVGPTNNGCDGYTPPDN